MSSRSKKRQLNYTGHYKHSLRQSILAPRDRAVQRVITTPKPAPISKKRQETLTQIGYVVCPPSDDLEFTDGNRSDSDFEEAPHGRKRRKISSEPQIAIARQTRRSSRQANQRRLNICEENDGGAPTTEDTILVFEDKPNRDKDEARCLRKQGRTSKPHGSATKQPRSSQRQTTEVKPFNEDGGVTGHMLDTGEKIEVSNTISVPVPKTPQPSRRKEIPCSQTSADTNFSMQSRGSVREVSRSPLKQRSTNIGNFTAEALSGLNGNYMVPKLEIADSMEDNLNVNQPAIRPGLISELSPKIEGTDENGWRFEADSNPNNGQLDFCQQVPHMPLVASGPGRKNIKFEVSDSDEEDEDEDHSDAKLRIGTDINTACRNFHTKLETPLGHPVSFSDSGGPTQFTRSLMDFKPSGTPMQRSRYSYHLASSPDRASGGRSIGSPTSTQFVGASDTAATPKQNKVLVLGSIQIGANPLDKCVKRENISWQGLGASDAETTPKQIYRDPGPSSRSPSRRLSSKLPTQSLEHQLPPSSGHSHRNLSQTPPSIHSSPVFACTQLSSQPYKKGMFPRLVLETESQFENAWHDYTPAPTLSDEGLDREFADVSQNPFATLPQESENHTLPSLSDHTVLSLANFSSQQQLTTIDITQSPPPNPPTPLYRRPSPFSSSFETHNHPSPILPFPKYRDSLSTTTSTTNLVESQAIEAVDITRLPPRTTSPSRPVSSSSPLDDIRTALDRYAGEWNGVRLTDSQLLPDSLINGSLVGPPMMMGVDQEDLEYEEL